MESTIRSLLITDTVLTTIKPLEKTAHVETILPSSMDLGFADIYVPTLYAYRLEDNSEDSYLQLVNQIKISLQKVLVPFFSFAGRWVPTSEDSSSGSRKLLCNDEGVPFIEASVHEDLDSVVDASAAFQAVPELHGYETIGMDATQLKQQMPPDGLPPIFVQVTRFRCGGVVLAVTFNHMHTDVKGFFNFMKAWSDFAITNETSVEVEQNRAPANVPSLQKLLLELEEVNKNTSKTTGAGSGAYVGEWPMKSFEVSASAIKSVKQEAKDIKDGPGFVSTGDSILALLWTSLARLSASRFGGKEVSISTIVEGRNKFYDPPLSNYFCGNVLAPLVPDKIPMEELVEMPVASCACRIRKKLQATSREDWISAPRWRTMIDGFGSEIAWIPITSWFGFPMYELDFGVGKPYFATRVNNFWTYARPAGYKASAYFGPPIPSSSSLATLSIWSTPEVLEALESDQHFRSLLLVN